MDTEIGRLLAGLEGLGLAADAVVIVAADHGEGLYQHGERGHKFNVYDELMRVPLIVAEPGGAPGRCVASPVTLRDVFPTAWHLAAGVPWGEPLSGRDLVPFIGATGAPGQPVFLERAHLPPWKVESARGGRPAGARTWGVLAGVVADGHKLVRNPGGELELYDLAMDPGELRNRAARDPERARALDRLLGEWLERHPAPESGAAGAAGEVSADQVEVLRALGYVGESSDG